MKGELVLSGVPVWDSISYVFMAYASFEMAHHIMRAGGTSGSSDSTETRTARSVEYCRRVPTGQDPPKHWQSLVLSATLMTLLDIVTDPLAVRGDQWFLGKIFYYEHPGIYFGVPFSNFAGWFFVGLIIFSLFAAVEKKLPLTASPLRISALGPLFYLSIMLFNLAITFWIRQWSLGLSSSLIFLGVILLGRKSFGRRMQ
ncbi:MAG: carotenoid biosynthesis protein [Deltaproteobacteria bacterium]|nr:carotenoid biosynthesis protein [Deltaproteobacteria bacterium]